MNRDTQRSSNEASGTDYLVIFVHNAQLLFEALNTYWFRNA